MEGEGGVERKGRGGGRVREWKTHMSVFVSDVPLQWVEILHWATM